MRRRKERIRRKRKEEEDVEKKEGGGGRDGVAVVVVVVVVTWCGRDRWVVRDGIWCGCGNGEFERQIHEKGGECQQSTSVPKIKVINIYSSWQS